MVVKTMNMVRAMLTMDKQGLDAVKESIESGLIEVRQSAQWYDD
jgi:hypothetical protein